MTSRRNMKATLAKVEESIARLRKVRASLMSKMADHDVITDYKEERKKDLEFQKGKQDSYMADADRVISARKAKRAAEEEMPKEEDEEIADIEAAMDELEDSEEEISKCAEDEEIEMPEETEEETKQEKVARVRSLVARMDRVADKVEGRNPKLAARIDALSNTLEKKYGL